MKNLILTLALAIPSVIFGQVSFHYAGAVVFSEGDWITSVVPSYTGVMGLDVEVVDNIHIILEYSQYTQQIANGSFSPISSERANKLSLLGGYDIKLGSQREQGFRMQPQMGFGIVSYPRVFGLHFTFNNRILYETNTVSPYVGWGFSVLSDKLDQFEGEHIDSNFTLQIISD